MQSHRPERAVSPHSRVGNSNSATKENLLQLKPHPRCSSHAQCCTHKFREKENTPQAPAHVKPTEGGRPAEAAEVRTVAPPGWGPD